MLACEALALPRLLSGLGEDALADSSFEVFPSPPFRFVLIEATTTLPLGSMNVFLPDRTGSSGWESLETFSGALSPLGPRVANTCERPLEILRWISEMS